MLAFGLNRQRVGIRRGGPRDIAAVLEDLADLPE